MTQAKDARLTILNVLNAAIDAPDEMAPTAPRVISVQIPVDKIGELIGPKGKTINAIQDETGADISIEEDGTVYIGAVDGPSAEAARAFAQCATAEMHSGFTTLRNDCTMNVGVRVEPHLPSPALNKDIARLRELWEQGLDRFGGPFLAGKTFTAIDAFYAPVAFRVRTYGLDVGPIAQAWVDHMLAHPAMQQWDRAALAETWREDSHEAEIGAAGKIVADYRAV